MSAGETLLYAALACGLLATMLLFLYGTRRYKIGAFYIILVTRAAFIFLSTAMFMMVYYFILGDFSVLYVWQYCSNDMSLAYKIVAVWAGRQGTYLLWAWSSFLFVWLTMEEYGFKRSLHRRTQLIALILSVFILSLCIKSDPFRSILDLIDYIPERGNGLNPVFITVWMILHPFVTFMSYASTIIPASAATVHLITGDNGWQKISRQWIRVSWFFLSICMATGGAWAYKLAGWGGFWNWDPVQTAALVMWVLLISVMHMLIRYQEGKEYAATAPVFTIFLFMSAIYITLVTRQGIIHSLHDFPGTPTAGLLVLGLTIGCITAIVLGIRKFLRTIVISIPVRSIFSPRNTFLWAVLLLLTIAFVCCWGLAYSFVSQHVFDTKVIIPPDFFNVWCYIPVTLLALLTGVCMLHGRVDDTYLRYMLLAVSAVSLMLAMSPAHTLLDMEGEFYSSSSIIIKTLGSISMWSFIPPFLFALFGTSYKFSREVKRMRGRLLIRLAGVNLIHTGFILIMLGAIVTTSFDISASVVYRVDELGTKKDIGDGWSMELTEFNVCQNPDGTWTQIAYMKVYNDGKPYCNGAAGFTESMQYGDIHDPMIERGVSRDIYVQFQGTRSHISTEAVVPMSIRIVPWISLLWAGCIFMLVGIYCIIISSYLMVMKKRELTAESMKR